MVGKHKNEKGQVLALSLVIMLFGTLVVGSLLTYVGASVNSRAIARDNLNAYYAADAGIQAIISKMLEAQDPATGEFGIVSERNETTDTDHYKLSDIDSSLDDEINEHEPRVTVEYVDMLIPDYVIYEIACYACVPGSSGFNEAKDKVIAIIRQQPYPNIEAIDCTVSILSWQRQ